MTHDCTEYDFQMTRYVHSVPRALKPATCRPDATTSDISDDTLREFPDYSCLNKFDSILRQFDTKTNRQKDESTAIIPIDSDEKLHRLIFQFKVTNDKISLYSIIILHIKRNTADKMIISRFVILTKNNVETFWDDASCVGMSR